MSTLLVRNAAVVVTMDDTRREIADGGLYAVDGVIERVGPTSELPSVADTVIDATGLAVLPGLVNTHHHLYQTLTRAFPGAQDAKLFDWLRTLYPVWGRLTPEAVRVATQIGAAELLLSGCTTVFDHQYLWPNGSSVDDQVEAAREIGVRFHGSRGSMSLGESDGGLPPDDLVEDEDAILADTERAVSAHHDPSRHAMTRIVAAPCSPFSVTEELMRRAADQARELGVGLHTHLAETRDEERFCLERFGRRPVHYAADLGWMGDDVWFAHAVFVDDTEITAMAGARTGVAHCPTSNMRLASGIAPVRAYLDAGVPVGIGVDGSASNDGNSMLGEARQALLLARLAAAPPTGDGEQLPVRTALEVATRGGAEVLGRDDIGALAPGMSADFFTLDLERVEYAGGLHDPVAATLLCAPTPSVHTVVDGQVVVEDGVLRTVDLPSLVERHNRIAAELRG